MTADTRLKAELQTKPLSPRKTFGILLAVLLLGLLIQFPRVMDFEKFGFYDEGAWLHLDSLYANGAVPGKDVGYSYGMLPLILSRAWFATFGRTPWAFLAFTTLCNIWAAWGVARIVLEVQKILPTPLEESAWPEATESRDTVLSYATKSKPRKISHWLSPIILAVLFLSYAIFPNNYSLMHPLEMALLITALAQQSRGRYGTALAFATIAVFTKPTMAYVLGLLLLMLAVWLKKGWRIVILPAATALATILFELLTVGPGPLLSNLLPVKGAESYKQMNFGIFRAGMDFWWPQNLGFVGTLNHFLFGPALFWILATLLTWTFGITALTRLARKTSAHKNLDALLVTLAILHAAFVFGFYAWSGSWTYYSYLIVLSLVIALPTLHSQTLRKTLTATLLLTALLGLTERYGDGIMRWMGMQRPAEAGGLFVYPDFWIEARRARYLSPSPREAKSLWMVNGAIGQLWPDVRVPPSWFLSPGIPTDGEKLALQKMVAESDIVVLCAFYDQKQEAWNWPELAEQRSHFQLIYDGQKFRVLKRVRPAN